MLVSERPEGPYNFVKCVLTTAGNHAWGNNIQNYSDLIDEKFLPEGSTCIDKGIKISWINDHFTGEAPDLGAYEFGGKVWKAGHDFREIHGFDTTRSKPFYRNRLANAAFEHEDHISPWKTTGEVTVQWGRKGHGTPDTARIRMGSASLRMLGGSEVEQEIRGLEPDSWYEFTGFARPDVGALVILGIRNQDGKEILNPLVERKGLR